MNSYRPELMVIGKRTSTWVLMGVMLLMTLSFAYVLPYISYKNDPSAPKAAADFEKILPAHLVANLTEGMPFYLGMVALVLGAMALGSEFNWKTMKTTLLQTSNRGEVVVAKFAAIISVVGVFTVANFILGGVSSVVVTLLEDRSVSGLGIEDLVLGLGAGWLILSMWAVFGGLLATLMRGTAMAIGLGVLYGLLVQGLIGRFLTDIDGVGDISYAFLRTNAFSLIHGLGAVPATTGEPGAFNGPFVDPWQALAVLLLYVAAFAGLTGYLFRRRDVS
jgi:ABC-type transport system involved in multi-copper enzyme maturation permease subunit